MLQSTGSQRIGHNFATEWQLRYFSKIILLTIMKASSFMYLVFSRGFSRVTDPSLVNCTPYCHLLPSLSQWWIMLRVATTDKISYVCPNQGGRGESELKPLLAWMCFHTELGEAPFSLIFVPNTMGRAHIQVSNNSLSYSFNPWLLTLVPKEH